MTSGTPQRRAAVAFVAIAIVVVLLGLFQTRGEPGSDATIGAHPPEVAGTGEHIPRTFGSDRDGAMAGSAAERLDAIELVGDGTDILAAWGWPLSKISGPPREVPLEPGDRGALLPGEHLYAFVETPDGRRIVSPPILDPRRDYELLEAQAAVVFVQPGGQLLEAASPRVQWTTFDRERNRRWTLRELIRGEPLEAIAPSIHAVPQEFGGGQAELWQVLMNGRVCGNLVDVSAYEGIHPIVVEAQTSVTFDISTRCLPAPTEERPWRMAQLAVYDSEGACVASQDLDPQRTEKPIDFDRVEAGTYTYELLLQWGLESVHQRLDLVAAGSFSVESNEAPLRIALCTDLPLPAEQRLSEVTIQVIGTPSLLPRVWQPSTDQYGEPGPILMSITRSSRFFTDSMLPRRSQSRQISLAFNGIDRYSSKISGLTPGRYDVRFGETGMTGEVQLAPGPNPVLTFGPFEEATLDLKILGSNDSPLAAYAWLARSLDPDSELEERHLGLTLTTQEGQLREALFAGSWTAKIAAQGNLWKTVHFDLAPGVNEYVVRLDPMPRLVLTHPTKKHALIDKGALDLRFFEGEYWGAENPLLESGIPGTWLAMYEGLCTLTLSEDGGSTWTAAVDLSSGASAPDIPWVLAP